MQFKKKFIKSKNRLLAYDPTEIARQFMQVIAKIKSSHLLELALDEMRCNVIQAHDFETIFKMIQGKGGFETKDRWKNFKTHTKVFVASEACDWFTKNSNITKERALIWGNYLLRAKLIENISGKPEFEDNDEFWRICGTQIDIEKEILRKVENSLYTIRSIFRGIFISSRLKPNNDTCQ